MAVVPRPRATPGLCDTLAGGHSHQDLAVRCVHVGNRVAVGDDVQVAVGGWGKNAAGDSLNVAGCERRGVEPEKAEVGLLKNVLVFVDPGRTRYADDAVGGDGNALRREQRGQKEHRCNEQDSQCLRSLD